MTDVPPPSPWGGALRWGGRNLYPPQDPEGQTVRKIAALDIQPQTLFFFPSPLLGYGVEELLARSDTASAILLYEKESALKALPGKDRALWPIQRVFELEEDTETALTQVLDRMGRQRFRRVVMVRVTGGAGLHEDRYRQIFLRLEDEIRTFWRNRMTAIRLGRLWTKNLLTNLGHLPDSCDLARWKTDRPVLVAGAGESLEILLPDICAHREALFVLAVDTALPVLLDAGLRPDAVVAVESQFHNLRDFLPGVGLDVPLLADLTSYPRALKAMNGPVAFFSSAFHPLKIFDRLAVDGLLPRSIPPLGSVGVTAAFLARSLTDGPIFLAGLDFSYRPGKSHCREAPALFEFRVRHDRLHPFEPISISFQRSGDRIRGKGGVELRSNTLLGSYAATLIRLIEEEKRFWDIGPQGMVLGRSLRREDWLGLLASDGQIGTTGRKPVWTTGDKPASTAFCEARAIDAFRAREIRLMDEALEAFAALNRPAGSEARLLPILADLDHLFYAFPDPQPRLDSSFLSRVLASLHYHRKLLAGAPSEANLASSLRLEE